MGALIRVVVKHRTNSEGQVCHSHADSFELRSASLPSCFCPLLQGVRKRGN